MRLQIWIDPTRGKLGAVCIRNAATPYADICRSERIGIRKIDDERERIMRELVDRYNEIEMLQTSKSAGESER